MTLQKKKNTRSGQFCLMYRSQLFECYFRVISILTYVIGINLSIVTYAYSHRGIFIAD